jgi:hypothetical protein
MCIYIGMCVYMQYMVYMVYNCVYYCMQYVYIHVVLSPYQHMHTSRMARLLEEPH